MSLSFCGHYYLDNQYHVAGSWLGRFSWFRRKQQLHFILNPAVSDCMFGPDRRNSKRWTHFSQRFRVTLRVNNHR
jgi:hypothetical protein